MLRIMPNRSSIVKPYFSYPLKHGVVYSPRPNDRLPYSGRIEASHAMTIAAGFSFVDGVLICADTEVTQSAAKYQESKISSVTFGGENNPGPKLTFAISGWFPHAKRAIAACRVAIREIFLKNPRSLDNERIRGCIEDSLAKFYRKHIFTHPQYGTEAAPSVSLIIGVWSAVTGRPSLLANYETVVNEISGFECVGIGSYFARYACSNLFHSNMTLREITLLATHVLHQTKKNVPNCGKESQFISLRVGGELSPVAYYEVAAGDEYSDKFTLLMNSLLFDLANPEKDFDETMGAVRGAAAFIRDMDGRNRKKWEALLKNLSGVAS